MIDAANITSYSLTDEELEERLLFWVLAAGKNGTRAAKITNKIIADIGKPIFAQLKQYTLPNLTKLFAKYKTGCQSIKAKSIYTLVRANLDLKTCSVQDLEQIYGIGKKTSRCFIVHSRENAQHACLDTHVLKFLKIMGVQNVPKTTPSSTKKYEQLEKKFLFFAEKYGKTPAQLDLEIWNAFKILEN